MIPNPDFPPQGSLVENDAPERSHPGFEDVFPLCLFDGDPLARQRYLQYISTLRGDQPVEGLWPALQDGTTQTPGSESQSPIGEATWQRILHILHPILG